MTAGRMRIAAVRHWFELDARPGRADRPAIPIAPESRPQATAALLPAGGHILFITGASGSGKTTLLNELRAANASTAPRRRWIDITRIRLPNTAVVNCLLRCELHEALHQLAAVGLAEAAVLLRKTLLLSDGEKFRLRVALALDHAARAKRPCLLVCDEFAAPLDEVTAAVVALTIRRACTHQDKAAFILATGREQLARALQPDMIARCDFGTHELTTATFPPQ